MHMKSHHGHAIQKLYYYHYGSPQELVWEQRQLPEKPATGKARIQLDYVAINPVDWKILAGEQALLTGQRFPRGFCCEGAGRIVQLPQENKLADLRLGERVCFMLNPLTTGVAASMVDVPRARLAKLPASITSETGAALPVVSNTALRALGKQLRSYLGHKLPARNHARPSCLVVGANGGVGNMLVQYLQILDCPVDVFARPERMPQGFNGTIYDYRTISPLDLTENYDLVFDCHGNLYSPQVRKILKRKGSIIHVSLSNRHIVQALSLPLCGVRNRLVLASPSLTLLELALEQSHAALPRVGAIYPYQQVREAVQASIAGIHSGKIVIDLRNLGSS